MSNPQIQTSEAGTVESIHSQLGYDTSSSLEDYKSISPTKKDWALKVYEKEQVNEKEYYEKRKNRKGKSSAKKDQGSKGKKGVGNPRTPRELSTP